MADMTEARTEVGRAELAERGGQVSEEIQRTGRLVDDELGTLLSRLEDGLHMVMVPDDKIRGELDAMDIPRRSPAADALAGHNDLLTARCSRLRAVIERIDL